jgi:hypothetical protein
LGKIFLKVPCLSSFRDPYPVDPKLSSSWIWIWILTP